MDYEPLKKVADLVLGDYSRLKMYDYAYDFTLQEDDSKEEEALLCETSACIAGWLCIQSGASKPQLNLDSAGRTHVTWTQPEGGWDVAAASALGVEKHDSQMEWTPEFGALYSLFHDYYLNTTAALEVLRCIRDDGYTLSEAMDRIPYDWYPGGEAV